MSSIIRVVSNHGQKCGNVQGLRKASLKTKVPLKSDVVVVDTVPKKAK